MTKPMDKIQDLAKEYKNIAGRTPQAAENERRYFEWKVKNEKPTYQLTWKDFDYLFDGFSKELMPKGEKYKENPVITTVKKYFMKDPDFNSAGVVLNKPSLDKGIFIYGPVGVGKSLLFEILHLAGRELSLKRNNHSLWFRLVTAKMLPEKYMKSVEARKKGDTSNSFQIENYHTGALCIDDIGNEPKAFGQQELLEDVLFERYRRGSRTFLNSNNTPSELMKRYGVRLGDRFPSMFNFIKWEGDSLREQ